MKYNYFFLMLGFLCSVQGSLPSAGDPYNVMGIKRSATPREVKQAYKKLAMEWHPDKNDSPEASEKFMAINQAYEVLSDPTKKERYDRFGTFDTGHPHEHHHNDFDQFFNFGGFSKPGGSSFDAHRITFRMYMNSLLEKSHTQPFIIYAYSSYCQMCFLLEPVWKDAVTDLESLGYGVGTVNYLSDGNLFEKLRITHLPSIVVLVEGRVVHFRGNMNGLTSKAIRLFARDAIPNTFLFRLNTYDALRRFLDQWEATNKPSILMLGSKEEPRLRYLLAAMKFSHFCRFAYICINNDHSDVVEMKKALNIQCSDCENIFIFKENPENGPVAKLISDNRQFSTQEISALIERNKFIEMPRLSSMGFFDELCPISSRSVKHFCVVLPVFDVASDQKYVKAMRKFVQTYGEQLTKERVHISSVFIDKQKEFVNEFKHVLPINEEKRSILVLWRYEYVKAKYSWIPSVWSVDPEIMHKSFETLKEHLYLLSRGTLRMDHTAKIISLVDEYAPTWFTSFSRTVVRMAETVWFHITKEEALPILSVVGTLLFIFFVGYGLNYLVADGAKARQFQKEKTPFPTEQKEWHPEDPKTASSQRSSSTATQSGKNVSAKAKIWREMEPMIHELRAETYFGLIRLLKPGCRSIIILVDPDSKDVLLPQFARHMYPLRNNKTFSFGFLMVNKNLAFFRSLLEHTLPGDEDNTKDKPNTSVAVGVDHASASLLTRERLKEINPKQTLGTVLVLCGWKLYFSVYHPMHSTSRSKNYVGFECSDDEDLSSDGGDTKANTSGSKKLMISSSPTSKPFEKWKTLKKIIHAGKGELHTFGTDTKAIFHYEVLLPLVDVEREGFPEDKDSYKSIDNTKKVWPDGYGKALELVFGKKFQLPILEKCVETMLVDEISRFDIDKSELLGYPTMSKKLRDISRAEVDKKYDPAKDGHHHHCAASGPMRTGYPILDELIESPKPLRFIIHLLQVLQPNEYQADNWQLNATQKLSSLEKSRQLGNELFSKKNYEQAAIKYKEALGVIDTLLLQEKPGDEEWKELDKKNIPFYLNLSQCFLSTGKYYEAIETASEVLKRDELNEKALFRRAKAESDLNLLLEHHPNLSSLVQEHTVLIGQKRKEKEASDKVAYKAMFNAL